MIRFELLKFFKNKKYFLSFLTIGFISFLMGYGLYSMASDLQKPSGFLILSSVLNFIYPFLSLLIAFVGIIIFSQEYERGTLSMMLIGRISRNRIIISKIISIFILSLIALLIVFLFTLFAGFIFSEFKGIEVEGYVVITCGFLWLYTFLTFILLLVSLYIYGIMGFMVGVIIKHTLPSIFLLFGLYFLLIFLVLFPGIQNFVFSNYARLSMEFFSKVAKGVNVRYSSFVPYFLIVNLLYFCGFNSLTIFFFKRMEI